MSKLRYEYGQFVLRIASVKFHSSSCYTTSKQSDIKPPGRITGFIVRKYVDYLKKVDVIFERQYPRAYNVYQLFKNGVQEFFSDAKTYYSVATDIWSGKPLKLFTRKELVIYKQMPSDMLHSAPLIISLPLPFVPYFLFPVAYMFPRQLLCRHFWTPQQRLDFALYDLRVHRLPHYPKILSYLESHASSIRDTGRRKIFKNVLLQISNNVSPEVDAILDLIDLFHDYPFGIEHLQRRHKIHLSHLCRCLGFSTRQSKLYQDLKLLHSIDLAICREGIDSLTTQDLQQACFARGLNALNVDEASLKYYLNNWLRIACNIDESAYSLLLHCPVLLSSTWPSNIKYIPLSE